MKMPLISVVLPIYNIESYLDRCMEAVLNQILSGPLYGSGAEPDLQ